MRQIERVPGTTVICPTARTLRLVHPGAAKAVLVLHGYTGYVGDMRYLSETLHEAGFSVLAPRLPGHGTNSIDFRTTGGGDWWRTAVEGYLELAEEHREVMVTGLSMGGVLSVLLAAQFPVARVALLAPALDFTSRLVPFTPWLGFLISPYRKQKDRAQTEDPDVRYLTGEYWDWNWPRQAGELYRLARRARGALPRVIAPTLTVAAEKDETVPLGVIDRIRRDIGASEQEYLVLHESGHVITNGPERKNVARAVLEWFSR